MKDLGYLLEFDKIIDIIKTKARSIDAKERFTNLSIDRDVDRINYLLDEVDSAVKRIYRFQLPNINEIHPINEKLKFLELGGSLSSEGLLDIASLLDNISKMKKYGNNGTEEDILTPLFDGLFPNTNIYKEITRCILDKETIADDASSALKDIRKSIERTNENIRSKINFLINGKYKSYVQDTIVTLRNNRHCILVKSENKVNVKGIVHDRSQTGTTLFIEPEEIVELNNNLKNLSISEKEEIDKILATLSSLVYEKNDEILDSYNNLINLDFIFAKAIYAKENNCTRAILADDIYLKEARHPFIDKNKVVPIDIRLGNEYSLLVITGPNTGGKTVALKTLGLLTIMNQAGLFIPAMEGSRLRVFDNVFADIGDEQSIEQSLSTFSSHMVNIVDILDTVTENSLCLFDELGAGTDPIEGAALAIAILDYLHKNKITTMATTHYSELKIYAMSTDGVENASLEFDIKTLTPTYKLLIGIPGKSNAFLISKKLGLKQEIIDEAKLRIDNEDEHFEDLVSSLHNTREILEKERKEAKRINEEIEKLKEKYEHQNDKLERRKEKIISDAVDKADEILREAKKEADEAIKLITTSKAGVKELERQRTKIREKRNSNLDKKSGLKKNNKSNVNVQDLRIGDRVKILSLNWKGTLSSLPDTKNNVYVQCGIIRNKVSIDDIIKLNEDEETKLVNMVSSSSNLKKAKNMSYELNIIGKTSEEAAILLDKFLDDAYLSGMNSVRIVHGKGSGILRKMVHERLKNKLFIDSFKLGEYGEGDTGVTLAYFK